MKSGAGFSGSNNTDLKDRKVTCMSYEEKQEDDIEFNEIEDDAPDAYLHHILADDQKSNPDVQANPELDTYQAEFLNKLDDFEHLLEQDQRDSDVIRRSLALRDATFYGEDDMNKPVMAGAETPDLLQQSTIDETPTPEDLEKKPSNVSSNQDVKEVKP